MKEAHAVRPRVLRETRYLAYLFAPHKTALRITKAEKRFFLLSLAACFYRLSLAAFLRWS